MCFDPSPAKRKEFLAEMKAEEEDEAKKKAKEKEEEAAQKEKNKADQKLRAADKVV